MAGQVGVDDKVETHQSRAMSWSEFSRFVADAEASRGMQRAIRHCHSGNELILAARRLGYHVTRIDLLRAEEEDKRERH